LHNVTAGTVGQRFFMNKKVGKIKKTLKTRTFFYIYAVYHQRPCSRRFRLPRPNFFHEAFLRLRHTLGHISVLSQNDTRMFNNKLRLHFDNDDDDDEYTPHKQTFVCPSMSFGRGNDFFGSTCKATNSDIVEIEYR